MHFSTLTLLAVSCFSFKAIADGGWQASCNSVGVFQPGYNVNDPASEVLMCGNCRETSGIYTVNNCINLSYCFTNSNGQLIAQVNGGFGGSCKDLSLSGTILNANCRNNAGNYVGASIDTQYTVGNSNGRMTCFGGNGF